MGCHSKVQRLDALAKLQLLNERVDHVRCQGLLERISPQLILLYLLVVEAIKSVLVGLWRADRDEAIRFSCELLLELEKVVD